MIMINILPENVNPNAKPRPYVTFMTVQHHSSDKLM